jgi:hypothetical protein
MIRGMLLVLGLVGHLLCRDLQSAPAPTEVEGTTEALLYVKRVPGKTDKEQAAIREGVLRHFRVGLDQWILTPKVELRGLPPDLEPYSVPKRLAWTARNVRFSYVEDTGVLRITCRGLNQEVRDAFLNVAVKACLAEYEKQKKEMRRALGIFQRQADHFAKNLTVEPQIPNLKEQWQRGRDSALAQVKARQAQLAAMPEVLVLDLSSPP